MPLFIPLLLGGAALISGIAGIGAAMDAKEKFDQANDIVEEAKQRYARNLEIFEKKREQVYQNLVNLGKLKKSIFQSRGKRLLAIIENSKTSAKIESFELREFIRNEVPHIKDDIVKLSAIDLSMNTAGSIAMAALAASGIYSTAMTVGVASTGTAISTLSGAAATNATLAWLGGGSLAAGGFGIAGGTVILGGLVVGPALAIMGFSLNSEAEKALTEATKFSKKVDRAIAKMKKAKVMLNAINKNVSEIEFILNELAKKFDELERKYKMSFFGKEKHLANLVMVFKAIKEVVNQPILDSNGAAVVGIRSKLAEKVDLQNIRKL